ncbi:MAG: hypothetical protein WDM96_11200 [Lacunisphaera sp.]
MILSWENYDDQWRAAARRCAGGVAAALSAGGLLAAGRGAGVG